MRSIGRSIARLTILSAALLLAPPTAKPVAPAAAHNSTNLPIDGSASLLYRPEVRLRKLHLVRPDLIPYPIAYEVYC